MLLAEMNDAVVIADDLHIPIVVRIIKGQELICRAGMQRMEVPATQRWPYPHHDVEQQTEQLADEQETQDRRERCQHTAPQSILLVFVKQHLPGSVWTEQRVGPTATRSRFGNLLVDGREQLGAFKETTPESRGNQRRTEGESTQILASARM